MPHATGESNEEFMI